MEGRYNPKPMNLEEVDDLLGWCNYKDWQFARRGHELWIAAHVTDTLSGQQIWLPWSFPLPNIDELTASDLSCWVFAQVVQMETHEAAERFQLGGDRPFWPEHAR